mmetsp:Transcript_11369/g.9778  ORF Transcript_11369/g.9778 Transcript_11369/m.9778 type:complete len:145 (-) Transcript_11369:301-735(-)
MFGKKSSALSLKKRHSKLTNQAEVVKRRKYVHKEDLMLAKYFRMHEFDWKKVAEKFSNRTPIMLKNRYYLFIRKNDLLQKLLDEVDEYEKDGKIVDEMGVEEGPETGDSDDEGLRGSKDIESMESSPSDESTSVTQNGKKGGLS